jgi:scyllo-inositol 2-dehydrogenase (NADP+)
VTLAIRHHLLDAGLRDAVTGADWAGVAGFTAVDSAGLLDRPLTAEADLVLVLVDGLHGSDRTVLEETVLALSAVAPVVLAGPTLDVLPDLAPHVGVHPGGWTPPHEIRLRPRPRLDPRHVEDVLVDDRLLLPDKVGGEVEVLLTASVGFRDHAVATLTADGRLGVLTIGTTPSTWQQPAVLRLVRHLAHAARPRPEAPVGVAMLGYGAIGHEHARAVAAVPGLRLAGVSDLDPDRLALARQVDPDAVTSTDPGDVLADGGVDLVVVSTPPSSHADWARRVLAAGKHVVLEKPMALTSADCDDLIDLAGRAGRVVVVYQNRRFDPDYRALSRLVRAGRIGEVFHLESFVGGYGHPCNYWHSDAAVSGGAVFDWGSHYLDQVLDLVPGPIRYVTGADHKRRWHDVTNADHSRVTVHFADGREAEFIHSDLAAAPKPKWLVLGTRGAVVGHWRTERVVGRTAIGTLAEDVLAPADSPARLTLHDPDGSVTEVAVPPAPQHAFHRELADHLLRGLPMSVRAEQSRAVVAVMEAAARSAGRHGVPVEVR